MGKKRAAAAQVVQSMKKKCVVLEETDAFDICKYLHSAESKSRSFPYYSETITPNMRRSLVLWLVEVADHYELLSNTFHLTVSYLDRFLCKTKSSVTRDDLQLVGLSCMLIALKYEESITYPMIDHFCFIAADTYTKKELVNTEADILKTLNYEMGNPTIKTLLEQFTTVAQENSVEFEFLACYLAELSLLDYCCISYLPSKVAASVIFLAKFTMQPKIRPWNLMLEQCTGYRASELKYCVLVIHSLQWDKRKYSTVAVREKYQRDKFKNVATLISPSEIPTLYFEDVVR